MGNRIEWGEIGRYVVGDSVLVGPGAVVDDHGSVNERYALSFEGICLEGSLEALEAFGAAVAADARARIYGDGRVESVTAQFSDAQVERVATALAVHAATKFYGDPEIGRDPGVVARFKDQAVAALEELEGVMRGE
ncbi:hypothetical protein ACXR2W_00890 [Leucobacter sp. HY1908]